MGKQRKAAECSFCGISQNKATVLIATPEQYHLRANICDACVLVCMRIVLQWIEDKVPATTRQRADDYLRETTAVSEPPPDCKTSDTQKGE